MNIKAIEEFESIFFITKFRFKKFNIISNNDLIMFQIKTFLYNFIITIIHTI